MGHCAAQKVTDNPTKVTEIPPYKGEIVKIVF
jgi:hypothetical protein